MALQDKLTALRNSLNLKIALDAPLEISQPVVARIENLPSSLSLVDTVTDVKNCKVELTWITKDVLFKAGNFENALQTFPPNLTALNEIIQVAQSLATPASLLPLPGVPGIIGQLIGSVPVPTTVSTETPISAKVEWAVLDKDGAALDSNLFKNLGASPERAVFVLAPDVVSASEAAAPSVRKIKATVTLEAKVGNATLTAPPLDLVVPFSVPPLKIPTLITLFVHGLFDLSTRPGGRHGNALFLVPPEVPYRSLSTLAEAIRGLARVVEPLSGHFPDLLGKGSLIFFAKLLLRYAGFLTALAEPGIQATFLFLGSHEEPNLSDFKFPDEQDVNDTFSSMLLFGMPGKGGRFFNNEEHKEDEGAWEVKVPKESIAVMIESLHAHGADDPPSSNPEGATSLIHKAKEGQSFGDRMTSYRLISEVP